MDKKLKIIFMGTPDFAAAALEKLHEHSPHEVLALYSQPPRPKGRGQKLQLSSTHEYAHAHDIPVYTPKSLKNPKAQQEFVALNADIAIVAAYGLILPKAVLETPEFGCLNIHASLLPRWRGASPIQRSIWAGDSETGVTIMQMDEGLDTGAMIAKTCYSLPEDITCPELHDQLADMGADLILSVLDELTRKGSVSAEPQNEDVVTYAHLLKKEDGRINWQNSAGEVDRQIRALNPWPGTHCENFKIKSATLSAEQTDKPPGMLLDKTGRIACGGGTVLKLIQIQPAGKKAMDVPSAVNGGYISVGDVLL